MSNAWKLRALVYGMLAAVAALVLVARPAAHGGEVATDDYVGQTAQGTHLEISMVGRRFHSLNAAGIWASCRRRARVGVTWAPTEGQRNVAYSQRGSEFSVHEWPSPGFPHPPGARVNLYLRGNLNWDVHRIDGVITYVETGARGSCASGPIRFAVFR